MTKAALPLLIRSGGGVIINTSSLAAEKGYAFLGNSAHAAAKAGIIALTRQLAVELAPHHIRVNALVAGVIESHKTAALFSNPAMKQKVIDHLLIKRLGQPEDYAKAALFLASDDSSFMDGAALVIDGGDSAW
jgi:NAD(P)-dependent dehydrogenase (short-subunit alcohol dehydrogenase family)